MSSLKVASAEPVGEPPLFELSVAKTCAPVACATSLTTGLFIFDFEGPDAAIGDGFAAGALFALAISAGVNSTPLGEITYQIPPTPWPFVSPAF